MANAPGRNDTFVFDAYGTLFDVHSAVARHTAAIGPEAARISDLWRTKHLEYTWVLSLAGEWRDFWTLAGEALDFAMARVPGADPALRPVLLASYRRLAAFEDARAALERLKGRGARTAILSNGGQAMLDEVVAANGLGPLLDAVLSVDAVRVFKPDRRVYALVGERFGASPAQVAFVSSNRWDIAGAAAYGFAPVWVNRTGAPPEYPGLDPVAEVRDLTGLG